MATLIVVGVAGICAICAVILALFHIYCHLSNYTEPTYQRYTVRIVFMVPVYALMSFLSLIAPDKSIYFNSARDIYEAWVIYNFLSLCLAWVGGPGAVVTNLAGRFLKPSWHLMTCCLPAIALDGRFIRRCKQGCLQFVILKPLLVAASLYMYYRDKYDDGNFSSKSGYLYVTIIYTISYTTALCALLLFYFACRDLLRPFKPMPKFIIIKSVVFLTYWQGVFVYGLVTMGVIKNEDDASDVQNFIICVEMLAAAVGHLYAFPYKEYAEANVGFSGGLGNSITHALNFNDVVYDTMHQFAPTYHNYVLYSDGSQDAPNRYRVRTFVPTGQEMESLRKSKMGTGVAKSDDIIFSSARLSDEGSSVAPEPMKKGGSKGGENYDNAPLYRSQFVNPYDMSPLDAPQSQRGSLYGLPPLPSGQRRTSEPQSTSISNAQRPSGIDSRRSSYSGEASETTRLSDRRQSAHGVLMDEIDIAGEDQIYSEGYIHT